MAHNFRVHISSRSIKRLDLKVYGEFDGSSAYRLFHIIEENSYGADKVTIDTNGLRAVHPFGTDLFNSHLRPKKTNIEFSGKYKHRFSQP